MDVLPISLTATTKGHDYAEAAKDDSRETRANDGHDAELRSAPRQRARSLQSQIFRFLKDGVL